MIRIRRDAATRLPTRLEAGPPRRTAIRAVRPADADDLLELRVRNRDFLAPWDPLRPASFFTRAGQSEWIALQQRAWADDRGYGFAVLDVEEADRVVGRHQPLQHRPQRAPERRAGLLDRRGRRQPRARDRRGPPRLCVRVRAPRPAPRRAGGHPAQRALNRVMEKAGFRREGLALRYLRIAGVWEDHRLYALTAEDFAAQRDGRATARR